MNEIEKKNCQWFDTGRFNDITLAYLILVLRATETPTEQAKTIVEAWGQALDEITAEEALERYRGNIK